MKLEEALEAGLILRRPAAEDSDFADLLEDPRFIELDRRGRAASSMPQNPLAARNRESQTSSEPESSRSKSETTIEATSDPRSSRRQLDFFAGSWDLVDQGGNSIGSCRVERQEDGDMLLQQWSGPAGLTGQSINFFDDESGDWVHHWVDSSGLVLRLRGPISDSQVQMQGEATLRNGEVTRCQLQMQKLDDGRLRHVLKISRDDGVSWSHHIDCFYVADQAVGPADVNSGTSPRESRQ